MRVVVLGLALLGACGPIVRPPPFVGARERVTDASLLGPFDGQILDADTGEPLRDAVVVGVWSYDRGDGFIGPWGSETVRVLTDEAGRYRIPRAPLRARGATVRLVSFHLVAYRRGYEGYRSDRLLSGSARTDFSTRHNRIELHKWRESGSHLEHLLFLAAPPEITKVARWERASANQELYRRLGGTLAVDLPSFERRPLPTGEREAEQWLDATMLLPPEEVVRRTGDTEPLDVADLGDLERTSYYHGVHLQATGRGEEWDVTVRVWLDPPDGLDPVVETFKTTLPDVEVSAEITAETWVLDDETVRAVGFIDRERRAGVLLTCGPQQCADIDTAIILAKFVAGRLELLRTLPAAPPAAPAPEPTREPAPAAEAPPPTPLPEVPP